LLVVTIMGVMAGTLISVINYSKHKQNAEDAVKRSNMEKLVTALETYRTIEGKYPADANGDGNPSDDAQIAKYIKNGWLSGEPLGAVYVYWTNATRYDMGLLVNLASGGTSKYKLSWGQIKNCKAGITAASDACL